MSARRAVNRYFDTTLKDLQIIQTFFRGRLSRGLRDKRQLILGSSFIPNPRADRLNSRGNKKI
jgi:hypothetical protein